MSSYTLKYVDDRPVLHVIDDRPYINLTAPGPQGPSGAGSGGGGPVSWNDVTGKPSTFPPSAHTHVIGDVTGLQTALDSKKPASYVPAWSEITGKPVSFPPTMHVHVIGEVT